MGGGCPSAPRRGRAGPLGSPWLGLSLPVAKYGANAALPSPRRAWHLGVGMGLALGGRGMWLVAAEEGSLLE